nr:hypothetical protein [Tanacetum cinerariifolium]
QTSDKAGLGYNSKVFTQAMFDCDNYYSSESDTDSWSPSNLYDRILLHKVSAATPSKSKPVLSAAARTIGATRPTFSKTRPYIAPYTVSKSKAPIRRPFIRHTTPKPRLSPPRVNPANHSAVSAARVNPANPSAVSAARVKAARLFAVSAARINAVKPSAVTAVQHNHTKKVWRPKTLVLDHVFRTTSASMTLKWGNADDEHRTTQNSGICSLGEDEEMYYGQLEQILEFSYMSFKTVLFRVKWFDTSKKGRVKHLVIRNNITQILANCESFKNDQYILATQVKQCFYLEDMVRRPLGWKVVEHVNHKKFLSGGVIMVKDDPDIIHVDNSSDLTLTTTLNDLEIMALHINGLSIDVDAPPDIINVDEDDDIIVDEDVLPHDLADSDDENLVNVDDDNGVAVVCSSEEED